MNEITTDDNDIRLYAAGKLSWPTLQDRGWDSFGDVLIALGRLGILAAPLVFSIQNREVW